MTDIIDEMRTNGRMRSERWLMIACASLTGMRAASHFGHMQTDELVRRAAADADSLLAVMAERVK